MFKETVRLQFLVSLVIYLFVSSGQANAQDYVQLGPDIDGEAAGDYFGHSVSLSSDGSVVAVGALYNSEVALSNGHVRIYGWDGSVWTQRGDDINGMSQIEQFGYSVSLSSDGGIVAVGGPTSSAGRVRVYLWNGSTWIQRGADIYGEVTGDNFGHSVSLSSDGSVIAIGAPRNNSAGELAGNVRIYAWDGTVWTQRGADIEGAAAGDNFGNSVSLSSDGNVLTVGAYFNDGAGADAGHVRIYAWDGTVWTQRGADIEGEAVEDWSGWSASMSSNGSVVAIGAPLNDSNGENAGQVRVYAWDGSAWTQLGANIDGEARNNRFGWAVSLSSDGSVVAIGAYGNDGAKGHVRLYTWDGFVWTQQGADIDGEAPLDWFGYSASVSSDGSAVAIGAPRNADVGLSAGHARVYKYRPFGTGLSNDDVPTETRLFQVHPHPVIGEAQIRFDLSAGVYVRISVYDVLGREVSVLVSRHYPSGQHRLNWSASHLSRGQYFINLTTSNSSAVMPVVIGL